MFTKAYIVRCSVKLETEIKSTYVLVNAGNRRGALTKFLFHIDEIEGFPHIDPHTEFISHKTNDEKVKLYFDITHTIRIEIKQINPHSDVIIINGGNDDVEEFR